MWSLFCSHFCAYECLEHMLAPLRASCHFDYYTSDFWSSYPELQSCAFMHFLRGSCSSLAFTLICACANKEESDTKSVHSLVRICILHLSWTFWSRKCFLSPLLLASGIEPVFCLFLRASRCGCFSFFVRFGLCVLVMTMHSSRGRLRTQGGYVPLWFELDDEWLSTAERFELSSLTNRGVSHVELCCATCFLACGAQAWKSELVVGGEGEGHADSCRWIGSGEGRMLDLDRGTRRPGD